MNIVKYKTAEAIMANVIRAVFSILSNILLYLTSATFVALNAIPTSLLFVLFHHAVIKQDTLTIFPEIELRPNHSPMGFNR